MEETKSPYQCHIFVCTNDRKGERKSCADGNSSSVRKKLKKEVKNQGWVGKVRVSQSGCLGVCQKGPNVMIYPQQIWFSAVSENDIAEIVIKVESIMNSGGRNTL